MPRVYLAGPDVFERDASAAGRRLVELCARHGLEGVFPLDGEVELADGDPRGNGLAISRANEALIRTCDAVLANLTPFRGPSADVGTAFEVGFARALGLPIVGYTRARGTLLERTLAALESVEQGDPPRDADGLAIEDFGLVDNLMLPGAISASGGALVTPVEADEHGADVVELAAAALAERLRVGHPPAWTRRATRTPIE